MQKDKLDTYRDLASELLNKFMDSKCPLEKARIKSDILFVWDTIRLLKLETKIYSA
jgi:hypothetical protein